MPLLFGATTITPLLLPALAIVAIAAAMVFVFMVAILLFRQIRTSRELLHAERMQMLELGMPLATPEQINTQAKYMHTAFWISFWVGTGVPIAAFFAASAASREIHGDIGLGMVIWITASLASIGAVVCATILMISTCPKTKP